MHSETHCAGNGGRSGEVQGSERLLLAEHGICGIKRLRITPTPDHDDDALAEALLDVWGVLDCHCYTTR